MRMSGTIEKADGNVLSLKSSDGAEVNLTLTENAMIIAVVKGSMADIKEGTYLGSAAMPQPDGTVLAATKKPDGTLEANRINVGRDGVVPQ
jgi:hypothetical protein